jgi:hypothetical protein
MNLVCASTSPLSCGWIEKGSEARLGDYAYAVCTRDRHRDRIVNEVDCARCALWREPVGEDAGPPTTWTQGFSF